MGVDRLPRAMLIVLAIALGGGIVTWLLGDPIGGLTELVLRVRHPLLSLLIGALALGLLVGPHLLRRVPRAVELDPALGLLRIGRTTVPATELRRAWRSSMALASGVESRLRLELPRALDPVIVLSPELAPAQLAALRAIVEAAPIQAPPNAPLVPPFADELGEREAERIGDLIGLALLDAVDAAYRKPTLLAELDALAAGRRRELPTDAEALVARWLEEAEVRSGRRSVLPEPAAEPPMTPSLGSMLGRRFGRRRTAVEDWLIRAAEAGKIHRHTRRSTLGVLLVVVSLVLPVIAFLAILLSAAASALGWSSWMIWGASAWAIGPAVLVVIAVFGGSQDLAPETWMVPLGVVLTAGSIPVFVRFYHVFATDGRLRMRRAGLESDTLRLSAGLPEPTARRGR